MGRPRSASGRVRRWMLLLACVAVGPLGAGTSEAARKKKGKAHAPAVQPAEPPAKEEVSSSAPSGEDETSGEKAGGAEPAARVSDRQAKTDAHPQEAPSSEGALAGSHREGSAPSVQASEDGDERLSEPVAADDDRAWLWRAFPAIPAPPLRGLRASSRIYLDASMVRSRDLSALPYIAGSGTNYRTAFGGSWARGGFQLDGEITFAQATSIYVTQVPGGMPIPEDQHQTAKSLGDSYLGLSWTTPLSDWPVQVGAGLRGRIPTHTTIFQFHLLDGSLGQYPFPYYFHIEPALLGAVGFGPLTLVINEGPLVLIGPDGNFAELRIVVPTLWFWDSHVALALALGRYLGLSAELVTTFLTSHIDQPEFAKLNGLVAVSLNPAVQFRLDRFQVDVVGRFGLNKGAEAYGVVVFSGTQGLLLRVSLFFP